MLVKRLVDYASRDPQAKPFHRSLRFDWHLRLDQDGTPLSEALESLVYTDPRGKPRGAEHTVPVVVRTVGVSPNLAADDVQYVLGWPDTDSNPERVARCRAAFADLSRRWADSPEGRDDPIARAVSRFCASGAADRLRRDPEILAKQRVLITVDGTDAYRAPSVVPFWNAEVARRKGDGRYGLCLVCGQSGPLLDTVPGKVPARLVPGASNDAALVSLNERVFGYDLSVQLACSPICITCGEGLSAGLSRLLESEDTASYGGQDSRMAWWTTEPVEVNAMRLIIDAEPEKVRALFTSVRKGRSSDDEPIDTARFCALTVGGNVARVMIRDWLDMPLSTVEKNVQKWFTESKVVTLHTEEPEHHSLTRLVRVTGRWLTAENRYAPIGAKGADRPDGVQRDLLRAALRGTLLPPSLLLHLLHRIRTDGRLDTPRAALLRLALTRTPSITEKPMAGLDHDNTDPAYVAGRIFAALDALQYDAMQGKVNTTFANRHFAGAIANPRAALIAGGKMADAWLRKFRGNRVGVGVNHSRELTELHNLLGSDGVPARTNPRQQSLFLLGYHHQRAHRFKVLRERADARGTSNPDDPTTPNQENDQ